jgi:methionine synthase II (cobalamin-independent)
MELLKSGQSFMIGSMPHKRADDAFAVLEEFPLDIQTWPQLPARSFVEGMIPQCSEGFPGIEIDAEGKSIRLVRGDDLLESMTKAYEAVLAEDRDFFSISGEFAEGLHRFLELNGNRDPLPVVKGQITGPFTFGLGLNDAEGRAIWWDDSYRDLIYAGLALKGTWQVEKLKDVADVVLMFCDEPILSALGTPAYMGVRNEEVVEGLNRVIDPLKTTGAIVGMHCCGNMDWAVTTRANLDVISFDAYEFGDKSTIYAAEISNFLERGGYLAWGIVPTGDTDAVARETVDSLLEKMNRLIKLFCNAGIDGDLLRKRSLYTPSCGVGSLSEDAAARVFELLAGLKSRLEWE